MMDTLATFDVFIVTDRQDMTRTSQRDGSTRLFILGTAVSDTEQSKLM